MTTTKASYTMFKQAMHRDLLTHEREMELVRSWKENKDQGALDELILAYSKIAMKMARRYSSYGANPEDLFQEAHVGMLKAAERFDPDKEVRFGTYAEFWIRNSIQSYIIENWSGFKLGQSGDWKKLFFQLKRMKSAEEEKIQALGLPIDPPEILNKIARQEGISVNLVKTVDSILSNPVGTLNAPAGGEATSDLQDSIPDDRALPSEVIEERDTLAKAIKKLTEAMTILTSREFDIIQRRFLREDDEIDTLETIAADYDLSKERIRQIQEQAMAKIKKAMADNPFSPALGLKKAMYPLRKN